MHQYGRIPLALSKRIGVEQLVKALEGKGHVVQAGSLGGAEIAALAFARLARCEAAGIEEGDAMVLVVIAMNEMKSFS